MTLAERDETELAQAMADALEPFAALARKRYPEEGGSPSIIDIMTCMGEHDDVELRSFIAASDRISILWGNDFRAAEAAIAAWNKRAAS